jgi:hypothetical protein
MVWLGWAMVRLGRGVELAVDRVMVACDSNCDVTACFTI